MSGVADAAPFGIASRLWTYQAERFPLVRTVPLLLAFSASSVTASAHLAGRFVPGAAAYATAFVVVLVFFWQMRVADEVKDAETDLSTFIALAAAFAFHRLLTLLVFAVWAWLGLMTVEFLVPKLLHRSPALYLVTHMAIMPLIDLVLTGCEWVPAGKGLPSGIWTFLLMSLANGCIAEFGRKIWAASNERPGVDSYSSAWGIPRANAALAVAWAAAFAALVGYGSQLGMAIWFAGAATMASLPLVACIAGFLADPSTAAQKRLEAASGIWILLCYGLAAALPFLRGT